MQWSRISNIGDNDNFACTPPCSRIMLTVAMETIRFFIVQTSLSLKTKLLCISKVPKNNAVMLQIKKKKTKTKEQPPTTTTGGWGNITPY